MKIKLPLFRNNKNKLFSSTFYQGVKSLQSTYITVKIHLPSIFCPLKIDFIAKQQLQK